MDQVPDLDDACGAGTSASLDPSAGDYVTMIEDAVFLLQDGAGLSIPAAEIDTVCQVPWLSKFFLSSFSRGGVACVVRGGCLLVLNSFFFSCSGGGTVTFPQEVARMLNMLTPRERVDTC